MRQRGDGNVLLHETFKRDNFENIELTTWVFEGFVPTAKLVNGKAYSIISDHLGTPILAVDSEGNEVWNRQLDIYGRVKREIKASSLGDDVRPFIPFLYQGQYYDFETGLCYNRFRYYSPETGAYISQDPIGLMGGGNLYAYVGDPNICLDIFGLAKINKGKPKYAPNEKKWLEKGGSIDKSLGDNNWKYTDWEGNTVPYVNGFPDFKNGTDKEGNKTFVKQSVEIQDLQFNYTTDFTKANDEALKKGQPKESDTTWHHHENMITMQEVDEEIHQRFTHEGGCAASKRK